MKAIPFMENPKVEELLEYIAYIPCPVESKEIILSQAAEGNIIRDAGDAGCMPDETAIIIRYEKATKIAYKGIKVVTLKNGSTYQLLCLSDNKGAVEFRFGGE